MSQSLSLKILQGSDSSDHPNDLVDRMTAEVFESMLYYLDAHSISLLSEVTAGMNKHASNASIWRTKLESDFPFSGVYSNITESEFTNYKEIYLQEQWREMQLRRRQREDYELSGQVPVHGRFQLALSSWKFCIGISLTCIFYSLSIYLSYNLTQPYLRETECRNSLLTVWAYISGVFGYIILSSSLWLGFAMCLSNSMIFCKRIFDSALRYCLKTPCSVISRFGGFFFLCWLCVGTYWLATTDIKVCDEGFYNFIRKIIICFWVVPLALMCLCGASWRLFKNLPKF